MGERVKVAFLGTRHPHMWHRVGLLQEMSDRVDVIGFFDEDAVTTEKFAVRTGFKPFDSAEALLKEKPELVIIESMDDITPKYAVMAAGVAKALLIEKVAALSAEGVRELERELEKFPVHTEHGFQMDYMPVVDKTEEILKSGILGEVTLARLHGGCPVGCAADIWCDNPGLSDGLVWLEGAHMLDISIRLFGNPKSVVGMAAKLPGRETLVSTKVCVDLFEGAGRPFETKVGSLNHEDVGAGIALYDDKMAILDFTAWEAGGWCDFWKIELYGTRGTLTAYLLPEKIELAMSEAAGEYPAGRTVIEWPLTTEKGDSQMRDTYRRQLMRALELARNEGEPIRSGMRRTVEVAELAERIYGKR